MYLAGHTALPPHGRELAAVLACGRRAFVSHRTAAALWMLVADAPHRVDVTVLRGWKPQRPGIAVRSTSSLVRRDVRLLDGIPITSPARTVLDLAGLVGEDELERAVAQAEVRMLVRIEDLVDQLGRHPRRPGTAALRDVLAVPGGPALTRSRAEARLLSLLRKSSLPVPKVNTWIGPYQVDLLWEEERLVLEFNGFAFHTDRHSFERDRLRDAELQSRGYRVIRVTWRQLIRDADSLIDRIARTLALARKEQARDFPSY